MERKQRLLYSLFTCLVFIGLFIFFAKITPMIPFDTDDWIFTISYRIPIPLWKDYEPTRITPLVLMNICGYLVKFIAYPILHDYLLAYVCASALLLASLVTLLCHTANSFFRNRFSLSFNKSIACETIFLCMFFIIFRNRGTSRCMFTADNYTCIFFYTCSGILNAISILSIIRYSDFVDEFKNFSVPKKVLWFLLYYFTIFSNVWHSCGIGIFAGIVLINYLIIACKKRSESIPSFLKKNYILIVIELLWGICLIFEFFGGRAETVSESVEISLKSPFITMFGMATCWSISYKIIVVLALVWTIFYLLKVRTKESTQILIIGALSCSFTIIYLAILGGIVPYLSRIEAGWMLWFWTIMFVMWSIVSFIEYINLQPGYCWIVVAVCALISILPNGKYMRSSEVQDYQACSQVVQDVIDQIIDASEQNLTEATVIIPASNNPNKEWYFGDGYGHLIKNAMYEHGIIKADINIISEKDYSLYGSLFE